MRIFLGLVYGPKFLLTTTLKLKSCFLAEDQKKIERTSCAIKQIKIDRQ